MTDPVVKLSAHRHPNPIKYSHIKWARHPANIGLSCGHIFGENQAGGSTRWNTGELTMIASGALKTVFGMMAATFAMAGAASAQNTVGMVNPRGMVENFDFGNLQPVLTELGLPTQLSETADGQRYLAASYNQLKFVIIPRACQNAGTSGCLGVELLAIFAGDPNPQTVAAFNSAYPFISAGMVSNPTGAFISRYEIADYGIPRGNVASSVGSYLGIVETFRNELATSSQTISLDGYGDDMSARLLNGRTLSAFTGEEVKAQTQLELHQAAFEESSELVQILLNEQAASVNKITNVK